MSFAELRQKVLKAHALSLDRFGEEVTIGAPDDSGDTLTVRVKITHTQKATSSRQLGRTSDLGTVTEMERIEVLVSRDPSWNRSYPSRPQPGTPLKRAESIDSDRRPFGFAGEVIFEGPEHAVYVWERPRKVVQGRGL